MSHPKDVLEKLGASALRAFSQNFLHSESYAKRMVAPVLAEPFPDEYWEIGPGLGALTQHLLAQATRPVRLFEFDRKISNYLRAEYPETPLEEGDFLKTDLSLHTEKKIAILSNLPYHISSQILLKILPIKSQILRCVFTFQKEYGEKLSAKPRTKEYGSLSILIQLNFEIETLMILPASAFFPIPGVDSIVLLLTPKQDDGSLLKVEKLVRTAFAHRRKKLTSNLKAFSKDVNWEALLIQMGFNSNTRAEELAPLQYVELFKLSQG